jgi:uncharacterized protein (DUF1684 family)
MNMLRQAPLPALFGASLLALGLGLVVVLVAGCDGSNPDLARVARVEDEAAYRQAIHADRQQRDAFFRESDESPVPAELRENWSGLEFYPVQPSLRVEGPLIRKTNGREFAMATSLNELRPCREVGYFVVDLGAGEEHLPVYQFTNEPADQQNLFLPFMDATTEREETYPAGRYLEVEALGRDRYRLDFNLAYNPYCAYGGAWDCPVAPPESRLKANIEAGERSWYEPQD